MDSSLWFDAINLGWSIVHTKGVTGYNFHTKNVFVPLKIVFVIANSVDPDHLGLHCLLKNANRSH